MKYLVTILFFALCGVSYGQAITGSKTRTPGVWLSSKDTATNRTSADSIQIIANRADSSLRFYWSVGAPSRKIAFANDISNLYVPYTDASTVTFKTNNPFAFKSAAGATRYSIDDIDNFNFKLNGAGFDLSAYTRFQITDAIGTRFSIGGDGAISGLSGTFSSLTNRRVPFISTGGLLKDTTGFTWDGGLLNIPGSLIATATGGGNAIAGFGTTGAGITGQATGVGGIGVNGYSYQSNAGYFRASGNSPVIIGIQDIGGGDLINLQTNFINKFTVDTSGAVTARLYSGTLSTAAQPNITSLGVLTNLSITGIVTAGAITATGISSTSGAVITFSGPSSGTVNYGLPTASSNIYTTAASSITSSQLAASLTDETGNPSGGLVFGQSPTINSPTITNASSITSNGNVTVGGDGVNANGVKVYAAGNIDLGQTYSSGTITYASFSNVGVAGVGSITYNGTNTLYNATSDVRLKENITPTAKGLNDLMKIQVSDFNFKTDTKKRKTQGFIAQQLFSIYPDAVFVGGDDPNRNPWQADYGRLSPLIVSAVQELKKQNDSELIDKQNQIDELKKELSDLKALLKAKGIL